MFASTQEMTNISSNQRIDDNVGNIEQSLERVPSQPSAIIYVYTIFVENLPAVTMVGRSLNYCPKKNATNKIVSSQTVRDEVSVNFAPNDRPIEVNHCQ